MTEGSDEVAAQDDPNGEVVRRRRRRLFYVVWGTLFIAALVAFRSVLMPFFLAIVVAYVLAPLVDQLERNGVRGYALPRPLAVLVVYAVVLAILGTFTAFAAPRIARELDTLARETPQRLATLRSEWLPKLEARLRQTLGEPPQAEPAESETPPSEPKPKASILIRPMADGQGYELQLPEEGIQFTQDGDTYAIRTATKQSESRTDLSASFTDGLDNLSRNTQQHAVTFLKAAQRLIFALVRGVFTFFIVLMLSAYLLATSDRILAFFRSLVRNERHANFDQLLGRINRGLSGVVRGQLIICLINGVLSGILFAVLGIRYWPLLTLLAAIFSIIPIFGAIISSIPAVLISLQDGVGTAVLVLVGIFVIHQLEANALNPKILGDSAKVHPVLIVFAILAGERLFGVGGALLAVPVLSIVQSLFLHFRDLALRHESIAPVAAE